MNKLYLVSNNLLLDGLSYDNTVNLEEVRRVRPLSVEGYNVAKNIANMDIFNNIESIYSSFYSSALITASFLAQKLEYSIKMSASLNECRVGILGSKNMKMVKGLQDHDFNYKLSNGESLKEVGLRITKTIDDIANLQEDGVIFTHKRAILGFLLNFAHIDYNLDDNLILEYHDKIIYDDSDTEYDIYELIIENNKIVDINYL